MVVIDVLVFIVLNLNAKIQELSTIWMLNMIHNNIRLLNQTISYTNSDVCLHL